MKKCQNCQFYDRKDGRSTDGRTTMWGQCRRHSPLLSPHIPQSTKSYVVEGIWPVVRDDDWCGEWTAIKRKTDAPLLDARNLMTQVPASPIRTAGMPAGSLMTPRGVVSDRK